MTGRVAPEKQGARYMYVSMYSAAAGVSAAIVDETDAAELAREAVLLLGRLGGSNRFVVPSEEETVTASVAWDREPRLRVALALGGDKLDVMLDPIVPHVVALAQNSSDRRAKVHPLHSRPAIGKRVTRRPLFPPNPPHPHRLLPVSCCTPWSCTWWAPSLVSQPASPLRHRTLPTCTETSSLSLFGTPPTTCHSALATVRTTHTHHACHWTQLGNRHGASCSSAVQQTVCAAHSLVLSILSGNKAKPHQHARRPITAHTHPRATARVTLMRQWLCWMRPWKAAALVMPRCESSQHGTTPTLPCLP